MKPNWLPVVLIVVGVLLLYRGLNATRQDTLINVGSFKATVDRQDRSPLTIILGGAALAAGVFLFTRRPGGTGSQPPH